MSAVPELAALRDDARTRSAMYGALAPCFTYHGAIAGPFAISGAAYNAAFDVALGASCSLRESAYAGGEHAALFEELMRFYDYFGLRRDERAELPDHLAVELEFMHYLTHLESRVADDAQACAALRRAQRDFIERHLRRLLRGMRQTLDGSQHDCVALVTMAAEFVDADFSALA
ncbi:MAG: molecular chaperone TorD family protein [Proteobacteria bacterium]|nr:molecular chaperone TorD family protein [Pseudomonadota bacterium]